MRRPTLALLCCAALGAAEDGPRCTGDLLLDAWLPDLTRSAERWNAGPYPTLAAKPWAAALIGKLDPLWRHCRVEGRDLASALADGTHARMTVRRATADEGDPDVQVDLALVDHPVGNAVVRIAQGMLPVATRLGENGPAAWISGRGEAVLLDNRFVIRARRQAGAITISDAATPPISAADLTLALLPESVPALMRFTDLPHDDEVHNAYGEQRIRITLESFGLREHSEQDFVADQAEALTALRLPPARRELFADLPATTVMALVARGESDATRRLIDIIAPVGDPERISIDESLAKVGLPDARTLFGAITGDVVLRVEGGSPFPVATLTAEMDEAVARALLDKLRAQSGFSARDDGSVAGIVGVIALHAAWRDGAVALTTDPLGLDAALGRRGGFADHPEVAAAMAELRDGAQVVGVSRSAVAWEMIGRLALLGLHSFKLPGITAMPRDLAAAGRFGFVSYGLDQGRVVLDGGGLFGGPLCWIGLVGTASATFICSMQGDSGVDEADEMEDADDGDGEEH